MILNNMLSSLNSNNNEDLTFIEKVSPTLCYALLGLAILLSFVLILLYKTYSEKEKRKLFR
ncbi:MAG: hypothetical protein PWQ16_1316 [bacterium]|nr:hypothetical protein [bacterium]